MQTEGFSWFCLEGFSTTSIKKNFVKGPSRKGETMTKLELFDRGQGSF